MGVDMVDITAKRAALTPHRIAFEDALTGRTLSYAQLEDRCARAAGVLTSLGVMRENRVAIICRNRIEFFEIMFACAKLGAIAARYRELVASADVGLLEERVRINNADERDVRKIQSLGNHLRSEQDRGLLAGRCAQERPGFPVGRQIGSQGDQRRRHE